MELSSSLGSYRVACHAGGRGFESRRSRLSDRTTRRTTLGGLWTGSTSSDSHYLLFGRADPLVISGVRALDLIVGVVLLLDLGFQQLQLAL